MFRCRVAGQLPCVPANNASATKDTIPFIEPLASAVVCCPHRVHVTSLLLTSMFYPLFSCFVALVSRHSTTSPCVLSSIMHLVHCHRQLSTVNSVLQHVTSVFILLSVSMVRERVDVEFLKKC
eukprot:m.17877 g.17877  ORF g.17877 m.17877 type:complete len:123 (+) comp7605_c0_seq2:1902-2270(+)